MSVPDFDDGSELRGCETVIELVGDVGEAQLHGTAGGEIDIAEEPGVLVGGRGVPVHKGEGEVIGRRRKHLDGENVFAEVEQAAAEIEFEDAPGPGDVVLAGDLLAVEPDVGAVVHAIEVQDDGTSGEAGGQAKLGAIPPAALVRAGVEHGEVGEHAADGVVHAGQLAQVHAVERIFDNAGGHLGRDDVVGTVAGIQPMGR